MNAGKEVRFKRFELSFCDHRSLRVEVISKGEVDRSVGADPAEETEETVTQ